MAVTERSWTSRWSRIRGLSSGPAVLFSLIWQVFLIYPILAVVTADASAARTVLGLTAVAVFSVTYLLAFASPAVTVGFPLHLRRSGGADTVESELADRGGTEPDHARKVASTGLGYLAALVVCALATMPAGGVMAVTTFLPFLACYVTAVWPLRWSIPVSMGFIAIGSATAFGIGEVGPLIPALLVVPVSLSMAGTRISVGVSVREVHFRRALGVVEERERVARDLHDVLGHTLTALSIRAQLAQARLDTDPDATRAELVNIEELTRTALREMRLTVSGMRVTDPDTELGNLSGSLKSAGIALVVVGSPSLVPDSHGELAAWTLREAGTNVIRHSGAGCVTVEFSSGGVRITDDGVGIDTCSQATGGQGLRGLAARAAAAGARLTIGSGSGSGSGNGNGHGRDKDAGYGEDAGNDSVGTVVDLRWAP
ncbi:hypothetical protein NCCP2495_14600 [Dietzia sp. NCCP-2495]|uniref:sensor histidine kinase n=1 Tax=Dietzia sp. NCCP-2495 TaxID=2934675 RepID=UPI002231DBF4|nr:histidine kinase [Dietzia sp. NCCP-2495]GLB63581.1 hypothetical protein NCCP2495_14600 [Dietzia sp. NCCP-2495]